MSIFRSRALPVLLIALASPAAWSVTATAAASAPVAAPAGPSAKALAKICKDCGIVGSIATETRKGKASGAGAVGGAVAGGVVGNAVGDSTLATVGGAAVGGVLGNALERRFKKHTVWISTVTMKDGSSRKFEATAQPAFKAGDVVTVAADGALSKAP
jgi:outer membrane lipoprotein SlyB